MNPRANRTFELLLESASDAVIVTDTSGVVLRANQRAVTLFGGPCQDLSRGSITSILPTLSIAELRTPVDPAEPPPRSPIEIHAVRRGGAEMSVEVHACPIRVDGEDLLLVIARDMAERERVGRGASRWVENLRRSSRAEEIGTMAAGIAHDINSWLSVILSCTAFALEQSTSDAVQADIREAQEAAQHAAALTRRLLAAGRMQAVRRDAIDVNEALFSAEKFLRRLVGDSISLSISATASASVVVDPVQLDQIVLNLAVNARDAMPQGGTLTIETSDVVLASSDAILLGAPVGTYLRLSVADTGCGFNSATKARIFEPFFTTKAPGRGSGLGLSNVSAIVSQCGGRIDVQSEVGKGTRFDIYFPVAEPAVQVSTNLPVDPANCVNVDDRQSA